MIEGFLSWWLRQLLACLPRVLRPGRGAADGTVAVLLADGGLSLARRRAGRMGVPVVVGADRMEASLSAALGTRPGRTVLVVPPGAMLRRPVDLPLAAERDLGSVLRHEMDRLTPFTADEVDWTWSVRSRDRGRGQVRLDLLIAPRSLAAPVRAAFARAGHPLAALESSLGTVALGVSNGGRWRRRLLMAEAGLCAAAAVAAVAVPFARQSLESRRIERRIAALGPAVERADALRRRIAARGAGTDVIAAQEEATGEALAMLARVTAALPDDTYLSELGWRGRQLTVSGQSAAAPRLIAALSRDPVIRNPVFAAPIVRDEAARVDRFSIRAELAP